MPPRPNVLKTKCATCARKSAVSIGSGTWRTDGTNKEPRAQAVIFPSTRTASIKRNTADFGKGFNYIDDLPEFFRQYGERAPAENRFYRHNSRHDPELPFVEIHYDGATGKIDYIHVYEKQRDVQRGSGSRH